MERIPKEVREEIVARIRDGVPGGIAAVSCGVARRTYVRWLEKGRGPEGKEPWRSFANECDQAFAAWQVSKVREVSAAGEKDWRASFELLKRSSPQDFADPDRTQVIAQQVVVVQQEREAVASQVVAAACRIFADQPERLELLFAELAPPEVIEGEARELPALEP